MFCYFRVSTRHETALKLDRPHKGSERFKYTDIVALTDEIHARIQTFRYIQYRIKSLPVWNLKSTNAYHRVTSNYVIFVLKMYNL